MPSATSLGALARFRARPCVSLTAALGASACAVLHGVRHSKGDTALAAIPRGTHTSHMESPASRTTLFVIEDDPDTYLAIVQVFRAEGRRVERCHSGVQAFVSAKESALPIIVLLCSLRHVDAVRMHLANPPGNVRTILITGMPSRNLPELSGLVVLRKPLDVETLLTAVAEAERELGDA